MVQTSIAKVILSGKRLDSVSFNKEVLSESTPLLKRPSEAQFQGNTNSPIYLNIVLTHSVKVTTVSYKKYLTSRS